MSEFEGASYFPHWGRLDMHGMFMDLPSLILGRLKQERVNKVFIEWLYGEYRVANVCEIFVTTVCLSSGESAREAILRGLNKHLRNIETALLFGKLGGLESSDTPRTMAGMLELAQICGDPIKEEGYAIGWFRETSMESVADKALVIVSELTLLVNQRPEIETGPLPEDIVVEISQES